MTHGLRTGLGEIYTCTSKLPSPSPPAAWPSRKEPDSCSLERLHRCQEQSWRGWHVAVLQECGWLVHPAMATFPRRGAGVLLACLGTPSILSAPPSTVLTITYLRVVLRSANALLESLLPSSARGQLHALSFVLSLHLFHLMTSSHPSLIETTREKRPHVSPALCPAKREPHLPVHRPLPSTLANGAPLFRPEALPALGLCSRNVSLSAQAPPPRGSLQSSNAIRFLTIPHQLSAPGFCPSSQQDTENSGRAHQALFSPPTPSFKLMC